jgi:hypothetical protein
MPFPIAKNYLYDLPEDIIVLIYKKAFKATLKEIEDMRDTNDDFNKLIEYVKKGKDDKNKAIWNIIARRDVGEPYYKYYQYYADYDIDFLILNKSTFIRYDASYSSIKYIEFSIYPIQYRIPDTNYSYIKNTLEQYSHIFLSTKYYNVITNISGSSSSSSSSSDEYRIIKDIKLVNDKIIVEFRDTYKFKCYIDIYYNILQTYNFIVCILDLLYMFDNTIYPEYIQAYTDNLSDLREWFKDNAFFGGFSINDKGDTVCPFFNS